VSWAQALHSVSRHVFSKISSMRVWECTWPTSRQKVLLLRWDKTNFGPLRCLEPHQQVSAGLSTWPGIEGCSLRLLQGVRSHEEALKLSWNRFHHWSKTSTAWLSKDFRPLYQLKFCLRPWISSLSNHPDVRLKSHFWKWHSDHKLLRSLKIPWPRVGWGRNGWWLGRDLVYHHPWA